MSKGLKVMSVLLIILAVVTIILSVVALATGSILGMAGSQMPTTTQEDADLALESSGLGFFAIILGILVCLVGIFDLITAVFGLRGANGNRACAGRAKVMGCITLVVSLVLNVLGAINAPSVTNILSVLISLAIQSLFVYLAYRVQKEQVSLNQ